MMTTTAPTRNGNTKVPKRYRSDAEPASPVPTIPEKSAVKTNSVEPIPAGDGMTAASMTESDVTAIVCGSVISPCPRKIRYGMDYQNANLMRFNPTAPATSRVSPISCLDASSNIWHWS